jgi:hypothetical protein
LAWWPASRAKSVGLLGTASSGSDIGAVDPVPVPWSPRAVCQALASHRIASESWEVGATQRLATELSRGQARFIITKSGSLRRAVSLVVLIVRRFDGQILIMNDVRNRRRSSEQVCVLRIGAHEDVQDAARRCVREKLRVSEHVVKLDMQRVRIVDEEEMG